MLCPLFIHTNQFHLKRGKVQDYKALCDNITEDLPSWTFRLLCEI